MIDFLRYRSWCLSFSIFLLISGVSAFFYRGGFVYGIDFTGGAEVQLSFNNPVDIGALRQIFEKEDFGETKVQSVEGGSEYLVKIAKHSESLENDIIKLVSREVGQGNFVIKSIELVGPEAGDEVRYNAAMSLLLALIVMGLFIALRQQYAFALGATAALAHDILVILTYCLVFGEPITQLVLMAVCTVLGYSINDTIVVFSRIKDNMGLSKKMSGEEIVNYSINQTLTRTLLTSFSTLLSMLAFYFFGGVALRSFSVIMILSIIVGTYSSIYIASPIMLYFNNQFRSTGKIL